MTDLQIGDKVIVNEANCPPEDVCEGGCIYVGKQSTIIDIQDGTFILRTNDDYSNCWFSRDQFTPYSKNKKEEFESILSLE